MPLPPRRWGRSSPSSTSSWDSASSAGSSTSWRSTLSPDRGHEGASVKPSRTAKFKTRRVLPAASRHVRSPREGGGGRRGVGRIKEVGPTQRKEKVDGTYGGTRRTADASAPGLPDHGAHAAASLVRPEQAWDERRLRPPGAACRDSGIHHAGRVGA